METNNTNPPSNGGPSQPRRGNRDEVWKEQIRLAIEESKRNIEQQQTVQQAPGYRITLHAPHVTKSYYDRIRAEKLLAVRKKQTKSESELGKRSRPGTAEHSHDRFRKGTGGPNVTSSRYSAGSKQGAHHKGKRKTRRHGDRSSIETLLTEAEDTGGETTEAPEDLSTVIESNIGEAGDVLSYFDPNYVKPEYKEILAKSRNIVIGPPKDILKQYFGYTDGQQLPAELMHDDTPKAFILPRRLWKDYDHHHADGAGATQPTGPQQDTSRAPMSKHEEAAAFLLDKRILSRMEEEKEIEPYIPRQPKNFAVDYLARKPFKKFGMISSNLNDASPGKMEHLELKDVNVDPGGHLRRDHTDRQFKISEVTDTPVKLAPKEGALTDEIRPWYADGWAEGADPNAIAKSPRFTKGADDMVGLPVDDDGGKSASKGKRRKKGAPDEADEWRKRPGRKGRPPGSVMSHHGSPGSSESSSSGYSCTCGDTSSSSTSSSDASETSSGGSAPKSKSKRKKKHEKPPVEEEPSKKDVAVDAKLADDPLPSWAPPSWKSPEGYKGWIYKPKTGSISAPDTSVQLEDDPLSRLPGSDWFRAFGVVKKAEKEGDIEKLRHILGHVEGEDDLLKLDPLEFGQGTEEEEEEEEDPMERLPRDDIPSRRLYPEFPTPEHFKYYRSYPLYPSLSTERYFEWYKDVDRLANPFGGRRYRRPAGISKSMGHINWDDPKEAAKWYAYGYRRPDTRPKPERADYNTKDYIYDNARSIMLMPPRKVIPKYIDDRKGTSHLLEPSGLVKKFIFRGDFGKIPEYLMGRNEELGRPKYPDMDKFYRPHRCKYLHGHIHCKICMRAHPTVKVRKIDWNCDLSPRDYEQALEYRNSRRLMETSNRIPHYSYNSTNDGKRSKGGQYDIENIMNDVGLGDEYRRSKAARGQNLKTVQSSIISNPVDVILPPVYV